LPLAAEDSIISEKVLVIETVFSMLSGRHNSRSASGKCPHLSLVS
jgi:hypothetical protein